MGIFNWEDPFSLDDQLNEDERLVRESARTYAQEKLFTRVREANRDEFFHREIMNEMGNLVYWVPRCQKNMVAQTSTTFVTVLRPGRLKGLTLDIGLQ